MKPNKNLYLIALSYKKADVEIRGKYAFFPSKVKSFVMAAKKYNIKSMYVLSTCNRTEFYAFAEDPKDMISLYASEHALGSVKELEEHVEVLQGREVVEHLIRVAAGLESQILGDFEIVSQIKIWFGRFQKQGCINVYLERMISSAIQISKKVKNNTDLSSGFASVSYAAVNYILTHPKRENMQNVLLYGLGKIGQNTLENLVKHLPLDSIYVVNRTFSKAENLEKKYPVKALKTEDLAWALQNVQVVIVATGSSEYTLSPKDFKGNMPLCIIDLSVPTNVDPKIGAFSGVELLGVDQLSSMVDQSLENRKKEIPKAEEIIAEHMEELEVWLENRKYAHSIKELKARLEEMAQAEKKALLKKQNLEDANAQLSDKLIQRITNRFASYLLENKEQAPQTQALFQTIFGIEEYEKS